MAPSRPVPTTRPASANCPNECSWERADEDGDMRTRRALPIAALVIVAVLVALVAGAPRHEGTPLDPNSTGRLGTKALVLLLREGGTSVTIGGDIPAADVGTALVLEDNLSDEQ